MGSTLYPHSSIHTHTHTNTLARMNEYQGKLSHLYAVSFHRPWNESCSIHIEIWEKRIEDFSKSLHLYVAAGLASVSVLYILVHPDSIKKKKKIHSMSVGWFFSFKVWDLPLVKERLILQIASAGHKLVGKYCGRIFEGPGSYHV